MTRIFLVLATNFLLFGCASVPSSPTHEPISATASAGRAGKSGTTTREVAVLSAPFLSPDLKRFSHIEDSAARMKRDDGVIAVAQLAAEIDGWDFVAEDQGRARAFLDELLKQLRGMIRNEVASLSTAAVAAPDGKTAVEQIEKIRSLLTLYPTPFTVEGKVQLDKISTDLQATIVRVAEIRRLRYNRWAITKLELALSSYRQKKSLMGTDKNALIDDCIKLMKEIDTRYLEPAVVDLYRYVFNLTRDAVDEPGRIKLARGFVDDSVKRKTPADF